MSLIHEGDSRLASKAALAMVVLAMLGFLLYFLSFAHTSSQNTAANIGGARQTVRQ